MSTTAVRSDVGLDPTPPRGPSPRISKTMQIKAKPMDSLTQAYILPDIRSSENLDKRLPLPTSLQADFIPEDVLKALVALPSPQDSLGPGTRPRNLCVSTIPKRRPPASLWGYPSRREKFKHLTENTPCLCGAGKDISFLYDVQKKTDSQKIDPADKSAIRVQEEDEPRKEKPLPDTLIPEEYHIVKNKGVMGLEFIEDQFSTLPRDHDKHLVLFPSMKPTSRTEVKQLKHVMNEMMERLGINDLTSELKGPTQMHNLIELIKKEQNIYNLVFHELIRQVSVECMDRGELLSALRDQYSQLLNRVPLQIKALHEEVMAQRALDRRLTEELKRFKNTIHILTSELAEVKEHDSEVTAKANQAQSDLKSALAESQKNASLLAEYHMLYEMQRQRLEKQVSGLSEEKDLWASAAYNLSLKVTEEYSINTAKRLQLTAKGWLKVAVHFTILLSDKDTEQLVKLQGHVERWREIVSMFDRSILKHENEMRVSLFEVQAAMKRWITIFNKIVLNKSGQVVKGLDKDKATELYDDLRGWGELLNNQCENFSGDTLLNGQDSLLCIRKQVEYWTDCSLKVFMRHQNEDGDNFPEHGSLMQLNELVDDLMGQYYVRLSGENGVANGLISIINGFDTWESVLNLMIRGVNTISNHEWNQLYMMMNDCVKTITVTLSCVAATQKEDDRINEFPHVPIKLSEVMTMSQKWLSSTTHGIDSEDAKLTEQVHTLDTDMVKWMVHTLLHIAPDHSNLSKEAKDAILDDTLTISELNDNSRILFKRLHNLSMHLTTCCNGIVKTMMQEKLDAHADDADYEYRDLLKLMAEGDSWIETAKLLLLDLTGEPYFESPTLSAMDLLQLRSNSDQLELAKTDLDVAIPEVNLESTEGAAGDATIPSHTPSRSPSPSPSPSPIPFQTTDAVAPPTGLMQGSAPEVGPPLVPGSGDDYFKQAITPRGASPELGPSPGTSTGLSPELPSSSRPENIQVIGLDANTHKRIIEDQPKTAEPLDKKPPVGPSTPDPGRTYVAIKALSTLQNQLVATEERAQFAEERVTQVEAELQSALQRIIGLERKVAHTPDDMESRPESVATQTSATKLAELAEDSGKRKGQKIVKVSTKEKEKERRPSSKASMKQPKKGK